MKSESASAPVVFVWGQLVGSPSVGYTIVAHSRDTDVARAETLRHRVMSILRLPTNRAPGQAFALRADDNTLFFMQFETSARPQSGGGDFTQEYYVVWDLKAFSDHGSRFWAVNFPLGQVYTAVHELALADLFQGDASDDLSRLWATLQSRRTLTYGILESLVSQDGPVSVATSGDVAQDAAVLQAVHLLVPPTLRPRIGFAANITPTTGNPFRVSFHRASELRQVDIAFQPEPLAGYRIPGYASLIYLLCESCSDRAELARLIEVLSELPVDERAPWGKLKNDLIVALWDRFAISLVSKLWNSLGELDPDVLILALWSREDQTTSRHAILKQVATWLGECTAKGHTPTNYVEHLADALQRSQQTTDLALHLLPEHWREQPGLALELCDLLVRNHDSAHTELWKGFILPMLRATPFAHDEHTARAETWLASDTIRLEQFFQVCDAGRPQNLYEIVNRLAQQGRIPNPDTLRELSEQHPALVELRESVRYLERGDSQNVATELVAVSHASRPSYERFVVLLEELLLCKPLSARLPRLIGILSSAVRVTGLPTLGRESAERLLSVFRAISEQSMTAETTRNLLSLGQRLGIGERETLSSLVKAAQLRYYIDAFMYAPDSMLNRLRYLQPTADLLIDADVSLEQLSQEELSILSSLYRNYEIWPAVRRLDTQYQRKAIGRQSPEGEKTVSEDSRYPTGLRLPCPSCAAMVRESDDYVLCPKCKRPYHRECWSKERERCVKVGCSGRSTWRWGGRRQN